MSNDTKGFSLNHTMLRIREPEASLSFYKNVLGMQLLKKIDFNEWRFSLYFLAYIPEGGTFPKEGAENTVYTFGREAVLELTHNWESEDEKEIIYHNGNTDPKGFGHICISVPDTKKACERFNKLGVVFQKQPEDGGIKDIAFIKDPDGYWIEIIQPDKMQEILNNTL